MTACFDITSIVTKEDIANVLATSDDECVAISYNNGDTEQYDRKKTPDSIIILKIHEYIRQAQTEISAMIDDFVPTDEEFDDMYQHYLAERDSLGDAEDAVLHHWA